MPAVQDKPKYQAVIGLEVHARLSTRTKLFCGDGVEFGAEPNSLVSPVTLAHPGSLPRTNRKAVELALKMGLACRCSISRTNLFARKNYFYPDLPKGYQLSQHELPICSGGVVTIQVNGTEKQIQLSHIHLEEDAGKSIHDQDAQYTLVDFNRAGSCLIEIVSQPCIHSADEAYEYLSMIRRIVRWLDICDGNMEEGSLRCDANISIREYGSSALGTRVEVKNLNSTRNLKKAIEVEVARLSAIMDAGGTIRQETRGFDAARDTTYPLREKEEANDYRYFPDPDLAPVIIDDAMLNRVMAEMPVLPGELSKRYTSELGLTAYDAAQLTEDRETNELFSRITAHQVDNKAAANWIIGPLRQLQNEGAATIETILAHAAQIAALIRMVELGQLSFSAASSKLLPRLLQTGEDPQAIAEAENLLQVSDNAELEQWVAAAMANLADKVAEYRKGKKALLGLFVGEVKKISRGKADPKKVNQLLEQKLNNR